MARPGNTTGSGTRSSPAQATKRGFISYAHEDHDMFVAFQPYMKAIERGFPWVEVKADPLIRPGKEWEQEIRAMIGQAEMFVLLVSPAFLASDFIWDTELPEMRRRRQEVGGLLLPVVLKPCLWKVVCEAIQAVPRSGGKLKPIEEWDDPARGFACAHEEIAAEIERHFQIPIRSFDWSAR
jgi:hypothetical protein